jgi:lysophospholipase L1-like esterase
MMGGAGDDQGAAGAGGREVEASPVALAVIGASSAAGKNLPEGGYSLSDSWVNRYLAYLEAKRPGSTITNLAVSGTSTFHAQPTGTQNPSDQPAVDPAHNVTAALATHPDAIIVAFPSQAQVEAGLADVVIANLQRIADAAGAEGVPVWVSTNQPNKNTLASLPLQLDYRDTVLATFGSHALDFWTPLADEDGVAVPAYLNPYDDVHPSAEGHRVLFEQVVAAHIDDAVAP